MLNGLSLFSGIGGLDVALSEWVRPVAYSEIDPYCQAVLLSRMRSLHLPNAPIWTDITSFSEAEFKVFRGFVHILYGGFPCQDISIAGLGKGLAGERSGLFFEIVRLAKEIKPSFLFLENVPAITSRGGLRVVREIAEMGYDCRWCCISAASVGACHRRDRWFCLARNTHRFRVNERTEQEVLDSQQTSYSKRINPDVANSHDDGFPAASIRRSNEETLREAQTWQKSSEQSQGVDSSTDVANSNSKRCNTEQGGQPIRLQSTYAESSDSYIENGGDSNSQPSQQTYQDSQPQSSEGGTRRGHTGQHWPFESREHWQEIVSSMGKCSDGISDHVARLRCLGNAVVARQAKEAFKILMGL